MPVPRIGLARLSSSLAGIYKVQSSLTQPRQTYRAGIHRGGWPRALGPGVWPGPRRQARRVRQKLRGQWRAVGASRAAGCEAPLRLEGPAGTMRGVPVPLSVTSLSAIGALAATLTAWPCCCRARQRDTAGSAGGPSPGCRAWQPPRRRTIVRRTRRKLPPSNGETPG